MKVRNNMKRLELVCEIAKELEILAKDFPDLLPIESMKLVIADRVITRCEKVGILPPQHPDFRHDLDHKTIHETVADIYKWETQ